MGHVLQLKPSKRTFRRRTERAGSQCQIVIFPGVRIERHDTYEDLDLGHRLVDTTGGGDFDGFSGKRRPRRSS